MIGPLVANDAVAIGVGAFCGAFARHQCGQVAAQWIAENPTVRSKFAGWHTAAINIAGSFVLGGVSSVPATTKNWTPRSKLMMGVGFCGSYTTFSTFSVEVANWLAAGKVCRAVSYVLTNNVGGVMAAACGMALVKKFFGV